MASIPIFGRRVTRIREERGLTQQELAKKAGTSYQPSGALKQGSMLSLGFTLPGALRVPSGSVWTSWLICMEKEKTVS